MPGLWRKKIVRLQPPRQPNNAKHHASLIHHACFFIGLSPLKDVAWFVSERWGRVSAQQQKFHWKNLLRFYFDFEAGWKLNVANCQRSTPADLESKQTCPMILQNNLNKNIWFHSNNKCQLWLANENDVISFSHDIWCISTSCGWNAVWSFLEEEELAEAVKAKVQNVFFWCKFRSPEIQLLMAW